MSSFLPGLSILIFSIGISTKIMSQQSTKFKNLNYRAKIFDCDMAELLNENLSALPQENLNKCFIPETASHGHASSDLVQEYILLALDYCQRNECRDD